MECPSCHRKMDDKEPIHRVSFSWWHHSSVIRLICRACAVSSGGEWRKWRSPRTCEGCGRPVIHDINRRPPEHVICSQRCHRVVRAAVTRVQRKRQSRRCVCGIEFKPTRGNARYCTAACKQRAYRRRLAAIGGEQSGAGRFAAGRLKLAEIGPQLGAIAAARSVPAPAPSAPDRAADGRAGGTTRSTSRRGPRASSTSACPSSRCTSRRAAADTWPTCWAVAGGWVRRGRSLAPRPWHEHQHKGDADEHRQAEDGLQGTEVQDDRGDEPLGDCRNGGHEKANDPDYPTSPASPF